LKKIKFDHKKCMTCHTCEIACTLNHTDCRDIDEFMVKKPAMHNRLFVVIKKEKPHVRVCVHCKKPKCIEACEYDAISKLDDGTVIFHEDKCTGCWECIEACPFDAVSKLEEKNISIKCDLCGFGEIQACVSSCPTQALSVAEG
jgi:carbon-monoxide dehydrogenase iron sulfur subunit